MSAWISVKDTPKKDGEYLVMWVGTKGLSRGEPFYQLAWFEKGRWEDKDGMNLGLPITHWMPLPDPPECAR